MGEEERPATLNTKKNQSRKRRLMDQAPESVVLSRDVLLTISSSEYEELVAAVTEQRPLSESEKKEVRRQKRLIKNRESAAQSRSRKKRALETLEEENSKLRSELEVAQKRWAVTEAVLEQAPHLWDQIKTANTTAGWLQGVSCHGHGTHAGAAPQRRPLDQCARLGALLDARPHAGSRLAAPIHRQSQTIDERRQQ